MVPSGRVVSGEVVERGGGLSAGSGLLSSTETEGSWRVILGPSPVVDTFCDACKGPPGVCHAVISGCTALCGVPRGAKGVPGTYGVGGGDWGGTEGVVPHEVGIGICGATGIAFSLCFEREAGCFFLVDENIIKILADGVAVAFCLLPFNVADKLGLC